MKKNSQNYIAWKERLKLFKIFLVIFFIFIISSAYYILQFGLKEDWAVIVLPFGNISLLALSIFGAWDLIRTRQEITNNEKTNEEEEGVDNNYFK